MKISLSKKESEEFFFNALCNGLTYIEKCYGIRLHYKEKDYKDAKQRLINSGVSPCIEDILMQILKDGKKLSIKDIEGDGEHDSSITLENVHKRVQKTPHFHLSNMVDENDDAITSDAILQTVFFEKVILS